jgi:hypothetical protein
MAQAVADTPTEEAVSVRELSRDEVLAILDRQSVRRLGISGEEFLRRWYCGEYAADLDRPALLHLASLVTLLEAE